VRSSPRRGEPTLAFDLLLAGLVVPNDTVTAAVDGWSTIRAAAA
jgi:hypothetical protein